MPGCRCYALLQSWLVAHKAVQLRHFWQYGYSITFRNTAEEPLQLLKKAWTVCDITGANACSWAAPAIDRCEAGQHMTTAVLQDAATFFAM